MGKSIPHANFCIGLPEGDGNENGMVAGGEFQ